MQRSRKWLRWSDGGVGGEADCETEMHAVVIPRFLQSHSLGCDCAVNGVWNFKHGILAMLPSNSALENDSREQTRLDCWSASHLRRCLKRCCWEQPWVFPTLLQLSYPPRPPLTFLFTRGDTQPREQVKTRWQSFDRIIRHNTFVTSTPPPQHSHHLQTEIDGVFSEPAGC